VVICPKPLSQGAEVFTGPRAAGTYIKEPAGRRWLVFQGSHHSITGWICTGCEAKSWETLVGFSGLPAA